MDTQPPPLFFRRRGQHTDRHDESNGRCRSFISAWAKTFGCGQLLAQWLNPRRPLTRIKAPIFSKRVRIVPQVACASGAPFSPRPRRSFTPLYALTESHQRIGWALLGAGFVRAANRSHGGSWSRFSISPRAPYCAS
jgi:hypothetical protein